MAHVTFHHIVRAIDVELENLGARGGPYDQETAKWLTGVKTMLLIVCENADRTEESYLNSFGS